jgi:hypothetical protein
MPKKTLVSSRNALEAVQEEHAVDIVPVKMRLALPTIEALVNMVPPIPVLVWGGTGVGKTDGMYEVARRTNRVMRNTLRASMLDAVDVHGMPVVDQVAMITHWARPAFLPVEGDAPSLLFIDELGQASDLVQKALMMVVRERRAGEHTLPDNCAIVAATNRETDNAGAIQLLGPLANRFTHLEVMHDINDWATWAYANDIETAVIAWLRSYTQYLWKYDPEAEARAFPTPRQWENVSRIVRQGLPGPIEKQCIMGMVGQEAGVQFAAFLPFWRKAAGLIDNIIADPTHAEVPSEDNTEMQVAITGGLSGRATYDNLDAIVTYMNRWTKHEFQTWCVLDASRRDPKILHSTAYGKWATQHEQELEDAA